MSFGLPSQAGALCRALNDCLRRAGDSAADLTARRLLEFRAGIGQAQLIARPDSVIPAAVLEQIADDLERLQKGEPFSRIEGVRGFWTFELKISAAVLDPRPDTETLVRCVLERFGKHPPTRILDLGTGSGAILLALLSEWSDSGGVGVDISGDALRIARENARVLGLADRCSWVCGDWTDSLRERFSCIVSNPPYIASSAIPGLLPSVQNHDPILALDGGADGLEAYKKIFLHLPALLLPGGAAFFEIGFDQGESTVRLAEKYGLSPLRIHPDSGGNHRVLEIGCGDN